MNRDKVRHSTTPSGRRVTALDEDDAGDPQHQLFYSSLEVEKRPKRAPVMRECFKDLLERLSSAHDKEIRDRVSQLEFEKAELERQNKALRNQLVESRRGSLRRASISEREKTQVAGAFPEESEEHAKQMSLPSTVEDLSRDGASTHNQDPAEVPAEDPEKGGEGAEDETPEGGKEHFPPRSEYMKELLGDTLDMTSTTNRLNGATQSLAVARRSPTHTSMRRSQAVLSLAHPRAYDAFMESWIASPRCSVRLAWEIMGFVLIGWDLFIVPLAIFCYPVNGVTTAMEWITLVYWTLNIPQNLTVGYEGGLGPVMIPSSILLKYLKSWFLVDMLVLVPDWINVVASLGSSKERSTSCDIIVAGAEEVKLLRLCRYLRLMRLTRIARLTKLRQLVKDVVYSMKVNIVVNIVIMLMLLLVLCHFISCMWYGISSHIEVGNRWLIEYNMEGSSWAYLYATCLHWSLTQFTPAPMNIQPQNLPERVFNVSVVVCALVGFSYVVGSITGSLAQLRSASEEESKLFWDLRVYLKRNDVEHTLAIRIQRYLWHAWRYQACHKTFSQIPILTMLSEQLQNELLYHLHSEHLLVYPLFKTLLDVSTVTVFRLARTAISTKQFANQDPLFINGEKPSHMYIVMQGRFAYNRMTSDGSVVTEMVDKGEDWIAEPVLWSTQWSHLGDCTAVETSSLTLVSPHHFCEEAKRNPLAWSLVTTYCKNFLKWLNSTDVDELSDITQGDHKDKKAQLKNFMLTGLNPNVAARVRLSTTGETSNSVWGRLFAGQDDQEDPEEDHEELN